MTPSSNFANVLIFNADDSYSLSMFDIEAYDSKTKWQSGTDMINGQNCFALNFGYKGEIPFPALTVDFKPSLEKYEFKRYCKCFYVFVGGKI